MTSSEGYSPVWFSKEASRSEVDVEALVKTYSPLLFRVAHSTLRNRPEAEDTVQDVLFSSLNIAARCPRCVTCVFGWYASPGTLRSTAGAAYGLSNWMRSL